MYQITRRLEGDHDSLSLGTGIYLPHQFVAYWIIRQRQFDTSEFYEMLFLIAVLEPAGTKTKVNASIFKYFN